MGNSFNFDFDFTTKLWEAFDFFQERCRTIHKELSASTFSRCAQKSPLQKQFPRFVYLRTSSSRWIVHHQGAYFNQLCILITISTHLSSTVALIHCSCTINLPHANTSPSIRQERATIDLRQLDLRQLDPINAHRASRCRVIQCVSPTRPRIDLVSRSQAASVPVSHRCRCH